MVRRSEETEQRPTLLEQRIGALPETIGLIRDVLVELENAEFNLWTTVELARSRGATAEETAQMLREEYGSDEEALKALETYKKFERASVGLSRQSLARMERQRLQFLRPGRPPRMAIEDIIRHSALRAMDLGFAPSVIWQKRPGRLASGSDHDKQAQARARIVVELRDKGATLSDIGRVFGGRRKESVYGLEQRGRTLRLEPKTPDLASRQRQGKELERAARAAKEESTSKKEE
jgi:hypothetical protein